MTAPRPNNVSESACAEVLAKSGDPLVPTKLVPAVLLVACASPQPVVSGSADLSARVQDTVVTERIEPAAPMSVSVNGVEIHYVERGSGPPVVLIHGSLADYTYWELSDQIALLAEQHRVIAYSRRYNHPNRNTRTADHSPMVEAGDLAAFLERLDPGPVHLVGHSYGAYTALAYAMEHPGRLATLVLAEPPIISWLPDIDGGAGIFEGFMENVWAPLARAFAEGGTQGGLDFTAQWYFQTAWSEVSPEWQVLFSRNADEWEALAASGHTFPALDRDRVRTVAVPTLLLSGSKNAGTYSDLIDGHLELLLPNAERVIVADASHEMFLDDRAASAAAMLAFFDRNDLAAK
jgi:non-heme chloroperoxidase